MFTIKILQRSETKKSWICQVWKKLENGLLAKAGFGFIQLEGSVKVGMVMDVPQVTFRDSGLPVREGQTGSINEVLVV